MDIYVYGDESGVFDYKHQKYFVFGGLIFLSEKSKEIAARKYSAAEKAIESYYLDKFGNPLELKASVVNVKHKRGLFRSTNHSMRYAFIVDLQAILERIHKSKKSKQRYQDFCYKIGLKRIFESLISKGRIKPEKVKNIRIYFDEHTTATDGLYELEEAICGELKDGTYNYQYTKFFPPLFPTMNTVRVFYRDSANSILIRASDIIANRAYYEVRFGDMRKLSSVMEIVLFPECAMYSV